MRVSIIIPVKEINDYIREAVPYYKKLDYKDFEVLIFPDEPTSERLPFDKIKIIPSGVVGPAEKRDLALKYATGQVFAFTDDDAYPREDWLKNAIRELEAEDVGAVGGPAVTSPNDDFRQQASGKVYESFLCSGKYTYRYLPRHRREDDDLPSVNLIVKREVFEQIHGFDSTFYPGEDTKLCMDIVNTGKKVIYTPDVLVYHHRRQLFRGHLKQVTNYACHRGYFVKKLPQTSMRLSYFVPTAFTLGVFAGPVICSFCPVLWWVYTSVLLLYLLLTMISLRNCRNLALFMYSLLGIFFTHIGYGVYFVKGLLSKKLIR